MNWPGENLTGLVFDRLTLEAPCRMDARGLVVTCRCSCGRIAIRRLADLRASVEAMCRVCADSPEQRRKRARERYVEIKDERNGRRRTRTRERREKATKCTIEGCEKPLGPGRISYCEGHGAMPEHRRNALLGRKKKRRNVHAGDPGWEALREHMKERRRERRATDPAFRALEARLAREYRARKARERAQEGSVAA